MKPINGLNNSMNNANEITNELKELGSVLAGLPRIVPYSVPAGYFQSLAHQLQQTTTDKAQEPKPDWGKALPYSVPDGYFEQLAEQVAKAARSAQDAPYEVPAGYFDVLPAQMLAAAKAATTPAKRSKIIDLAVFPKLRWVAAAVLLICIGLGSYQLYLRPAAHNPEQMLAAVPGNEIHEYLVHHYRVDVDRVVSNNINNIPLDNKDIIQYLDETGWDVVD